MKRDEANQASVGACPAPPLGQGSAIGSRLRLVPQNPHKTALSRTYPHLSAHRFVRSSHFSASDRPKKGEESREKANGAEHRSPGRHIPGRKNNSDPLG